MLRRYVGAFRDLRHLPRTTWYVCGATLVNRAGTMVLPFLTLYLTRERHLDIPTAGSIVGLYGIGGLTAGPLSGYLCDRYGAANVVRSSLLAVVAVLLTIPRLEPVWLLATGVFAFALANETFRPASVILARVGVPRDRIRQSYGAHRLAVNLGFSIGPALGGAIVHFSFAGIFYVNALASFLAAVAIHCGFFSKRALPGPATGTERVRPAAILEAALDSRLLLFAIGMFPVVAVFFQYESTMPLFMIRDLGLEEWNYGLLFTVNTLLVAAIEIPLLAATQRFSHRSVLAAGTVATTVGFGGLGLVHGFPGTLVCVVFWTIGEILLFPEAQAYVTDIAPPSREGTYTGLLTTVYNFGLTLGPPIGTAVYQSFGARKLWLGCVFAGALSVLLLLRLSTKTPEEARCVVAP